MPRNIEIKARIANFEALSRRARSLAGGPESRVRTTRGLLLAGAYLDLLAASSAGIACAR